MRIIFDRFEIWAFYWATMFYHNLICDTWCHYRVVLATMFVLGLELLTGCGTQLTPTTYHMAKFVLHMVYMGYVFVVMSDFVVMISHIIFFFGVVPTCLILMIIAMIVTSSVSAVMGRQAYDVLTRYTLGRQIMSVTNQGYQWASQIANIVPSRKLYYQCADFFFVCLEKILRLNLELSDNIYSHNVVDVIQGLDRKPDVITENYPLRLSQSERNLSRPRSPRKVRYSSQERIAILRAKLHREKMLQLAKTSAAHHAPISAPKN